MPAIAPLSSSPAPMACTRCNGTGQYHGQRRDGSAYVGRCFACSEQVRGYRPSTNETVAVIGGVVTPIATPAGEANWQRFKSQYPAEAAWLVSPSSGDFGASLIRGCRRYGGLTPRQLAAVQRNLSMRDIPDPGLTAEQIVTTPAPTSVVTLGELVLAARPELRNGTVVDWTRGATTHIGATTTVDMSRIFTAFDTAAASGLRKVRLTLGNVEFKRSGSGFRYGEGLVLAWYKIERSGRESRHLGDYMGHFNREGIFCPTSQFRPRDVMAMALDAFANAARDPQAAARVHGHDTGHCSCCRRLLTDPPSVMAGLGPICSRRFGWSF